MGITWTGQWRIRAGGGEPAQVEVTDGDIVNYVSEQHYAMLCAKPPLEDLEWKDRPDGRLPETFPRNEDEQDSK